MGFGLFILNLGLMYDSHREICLKNRCFCDKELMTIDRTAVWFVDSVTSIVIKVFFAKPVIIFIKTFKKHIADRSINNIIIYPLFILAIILIIINFPIILAVDIMRNSSSTKLFGVELNQNSEYISLIAGTLLTVACMTAYVLEKKVRNSCTRKAKKTRKAKVEVENHELKRFRKKEEIYV